MMQECKETPSGVEVFGHLPRLVRRIRQRWSKTISKRHLFG
jgi:hypothetical protein